ncbi:hypothetical protein C8R43DRAFT_1116436 [Mycena crocata]|nr:hypothetical protein C8R43DRAFT_1116436 [Mycena crocata]
MTGHGSTEDSVFRQAAAIENNHSLPDDKTPRNVGADSDIPLMTPHFSSDLQFANNHPSYLGFEFIDTPADTLYYRYGFKQVTNLTTSCEVDMTLATVAALLGDRQWPSSVDSDSVKQICVFFESLLKAQHPEDIPEELYELRQEGIAALRPSPIQLRWEVIEGTTYYFLSSKTSAADGTEASIVLRSAAIAIEILRRDWTTTEQIAQNLMSRSIQFQTQVPPPSAPNLNSSQLAHRGLGYRPQTFQANAEEYSRYEAARNSLFKSGRGRAALMMGGVIARLARDVVSPQSGSTKDVFAHGKCIWDGRPSPPSSMDDTLTEEELDIICGFYEVDTGQSQPSSLEGRQTKHVSWWPPLKAWRSSSLNVGYWTPSCEEWFQSRMTLIRSGEAQPHNLQQWRHNMTDDRKHISPMQVNDRLAEQFLAKNGTRMAKKPDAHQFPRAIHKSNSNELYFILRTQQLAFPTAEAVDNELARLFHEFTPQTKPRNDSNKPEVQQVTRRYWDMRRKISTLVVRGDAIEGRLRTMHVKQPVDIYWTSSELARRLAAAEAELMEERIRSREAEHIVEDIRRECKTPTVVPTLLGTLVE